jgi:hypothetical protein
MKNIAKHWSGFCGVAVLTLTTAAQAAQPGFPESDMLASRSVNPVSASLPAAPAAVLRGVDMLNLFIVVEAGDHHITLLDGDRLEPIHRFASRNLLDEGPTFTPDGRYLFLASRDGWITKFDIWHLVVVAEIRASIQTRTVAVSGDGKFVAVANDLPNTLVLLDAGLNPLRVLDVKDKNGKTPSRVAAMRDAPPRKSFVAALQDVPEVWEVSYDPAAEDIAVGMVHDFQYKEGAFIRGFLNPRRSYLSEPLDDFSFTPDYSELMGRSGDAGRGQLVNLDVRKRIADFVVESTLGSGRAQAQVTLTRNGRYALTSLRQRKTDGGALVVLDAATLREVKRIPMDRPLGAYNLFSPLNRGEGASR